jgi:hypothetical protein
VAETRQPLLALSDESLARILGDLGGSIAYPSAAAEPGGVDLAARARARIVALDVQPSPGGGRWRFGFGFGSRPVRRGLVLAIALLLVLAAIAGAVGLGLPGLRIIFGTVPSAAPTASAARPSSLAPLGSELGLGSALPVAEVERIAGLDLILPTDPAIGPPDVAYLAGQRATLVWASRPGLPATGDHGVGLLISEFNGHVEAGYYQKILSNGTKLTRVTVDGSPGYWISGPPHFFYYIDPNNEVVDDAHREVGDVLIWSTGVVTYRLESGLDMEGAIRIAESLD